MSPTIWTRFLLTVQSVVVVSSLRLVRVLQIQESLDYTCQ